MDPRRTSSRVLVPLTALLILSAGEALAAGRLILGVQTGTVREWTELEHGTLHLLGRGPLRRIYDTLVEPRYHGYLTRMLHHLDEDVKITLIDDRERRAVWPLAQGTEIRIGIKYFLQEGDGVKEVAIRGLLAHELAHTQDRTTITERSYGVDGHHYPDEILDLRGAMAEGWGNYHQFRFDPKSSISFDDDLGEKFEKEDGEGYYSARPARTLNHWMRNEEAVSRILVMIAERFPSGREMIDDAFDATNGGAVRTLPHMLRMMAEDHPRQQRKLAQLVDLAVEHAATDAELKEIFLDGGKLYAKQRKERQVD